MKLVFLFLIFSPAISFGCNDGSSYCEQVKRINARTEAQLEAGRTAYQRNTAATEAALARNDGQAARVAEETRLAPKKLRKAEDMALCELGNPFACDALKRK